MTTLVAENLTKVYDNKLVAVDNIDFQIEKGEVCGFLGPNGAGKSTTISMITGMMKPTSGKITVFGKNMASDRKYIQERIGYVPQELVFYNHLTVRENLKLFATSFRIPRAQIKIQEVIEMMGMEEFKNQISGKLSGGQKRRLNVAIGLLNDPELLVLDEPSAGMDPQSRNVLWESISTLAKEDMTIILTTHLMETADALSDKVCIIDHGRIKAIDTPENLKKHLGEGDVIELSLINKSTEHQIVEIKKIVKEYNQSAMVHQIDDELLTITINNGIDLLSQIIKPIKESLKSLNNSISSINLRDNTLEDVFIELTGRNLRE